MVTRSLLYCPGNEPRKVGKVGTFGADAVILDLEDVVPLDQKVATREIVREAIPSVRKTAKRVYVRINPIGQKTDFSLNVGVADIEGVVCPELDGLVVPKVMVRISAYGQTGPYRHKPGFGRIAQAFGGLSYMAGYPDRPPVNPGSATIADYAAGLFGAFSVMVALEYRHRTGEGQCIDISLYESIFRLLDNLASAYDKLGLVRERKGTATAHAAPHNHYRTRDGKWVAIACTSDRIFQRLTRAMNREDMADDPRYLTGNRRVEHREELDDIVSTWAGSFDKDALIELLDSEEVPVGAINSIADIFQDPQFEARGSMIEIDDPVMGKIKMPGIVPRMSRGLGRVEHLVPALGQHNQDIYGEFLGFSPEKLATLKAEGVI